MTFLRSIFLLPEKFRIKKSERTNNDFQRAQELLQNNGLAFDRAYIVVYYATNFLPKMTRCQVYAERDDPRTRRPEGHPRTTLTMRFSLFLKHIPSFYDERKIIIFGFPI